MNDKFEFQTICDTLMQYTLLNSEMNCVTNTRWEMEVWSGHNYHKQEKILNTQKKRVGLFLR